MANTIVNQKLIDSERNAVFFFSIISDGTVFSSDTIVDLSSLNPDSTGRPVTAIHVARVQFSVLGSVQGRLQWVATDDEAIVCFGQQESVDLDFRRFGGIPNPGSAGATGDIELVIQALGNSEAVSMVLDVIKKY